MALQATDMDWQFGSGTLVTGSGQDLALALCKRPTVGSLQGEAVPGLTSP